MRRVGVLVFALAVSGCATITRGTDEQIAFESVPEGAEIRAMVQDNRATDDADGYKDPPRTMSCVAPCVLNVKRVDRMTVSVSKPGFEPERFVLVPSLSAGGAAGSAGNVIAGGVAGLIIDGATGAGMDKCPNPVRIRLRQAPGIARGRPAQPAYQGPPYDPAAACREQIVASQKAADPGLAKSNPPM